MFAVKAALALGANQSQPEESVLTKELLQDCQADAGHPGRGQCCKPSLSSKMSGVPRHAMSQGDGLFLMQGTAEPAVHTLQTGWCFYAGLDAAKRSNVWVANQSPAALAMLAAAAGSPAADRSRQPSESLMQVCYAASLSPLRSSPLSAISPPHKQAHILRLH